MLESSDGNFEYHYTFSFRPNTQKQRTWGNMNLAVLTMAVDFRQLPKVVFLFDFRCNSTEFLAIAKSSVLLRTKVKVKYNFRQLPIVLIKSEIYQLVVFGKPYF
jgi:hypothetical protein